MHNYIIRICSFLLLAALLGSCDPLVEPACSSCDFLLCRINGKAFKPGGGSFKSNSLSALLTDNDTKLSIGASNPDFFIGVSLLTNAPLQVGRYALVNYPPGRGLMSYRHVDGSFQSRDFGTTAAYSGYLDISRIDYNPPATMEGTFEYDVVDSLSQEVARVTQGKFRLFLHR
jgi:hypothetical protein